MRKKIKGFDTVGGGSNTIWDTIHKGVMTEESLKEMTERLEGLIGFDVSIEIKAWSRGQSIKNHITFAKAWTEAEIKTKKYMESL